MNLIRRKTEKLFFRSILIMVLSTFCLMAYSQQQQVRLTGSNITLKAAFKQIEQQTKMFVDYNVQDINDTKVIVNVPKANTLRAVMEELLVGTNCSAVFNGNHIIISKQKAVPSNKSTKTVTGIVKDSRGEPVIGANVVEKGTTNGTITDVDGKFSLTLQNFNGQLRISYIGYSEKIVPIRNTTSFIINLNEDTQKLDEIVVVGYGSARKKDVTGALTRVDVTEMETIPNVNPVQTLRGSVSGVRVIDNGLAGSDGTIQVRGTTSISASNDPLIVLDGVPFSGGRLSDINTNDISAIDVLKDASSTAIYGSRGANGVIMITTKHGTTSKPRLNYNGYVGFSDFARMPKLMNGEQYQQLRKDAEVYMNQELPFQTIEEENIAAGKTIDAWDVIKQDAPMTEHELSLSGKGERLTYFLSSSYTSQKSPLAGDQFKRLSVRSNFDINVTSWLEIGTNTSFAYKDYSGNKADWGSAAYLSPYSSIRYDDGTLRKLPYGDGMVTNPLWNVEMTNNKEVSYGVFNSNFLIVKLPLKGLTYQMNLSNNLRFKDINNYTPAYDRDGSYWLGSGSKQHQYTHDLIFENIVKYNNTFARKHNIDFTMMYGYEYSSANGSTLSSNNIFNDALGYNGLGVGENQAVATTAGSSTAISSMARLGYRYSDKYMINLTVRRDGYSAFGSDKKYGTFPSVGIGWALSQEDFFKSIKWLDFLKLRLSWGKNGNRGISSYESLSTMSIARYVFGDGGSTSIGLYPTSMSNPLLGWETSKSYNLGLDFNVLNNRIKGNIDLYDTRTTDLLLEISIPSMTGYDSYLTNIGKTQNKGIELSLNTENIKTQNFIWSTNINFAKNINKILHLSGKDLDGDGKEDDDIGTSRFIGYSMGSNFNYVYDGIWQTGDDYSIDSSAKAGDVKFKDINQDGKIGPEDRQVLHNNRPKFTLDMNNTLKYRNFTFSILFDLRYGGYAANKWINPGTEYYNRCNQLDLPYWTPDNPLKDRPSVGYSNPRNYGFYEKLTYLRLQDVALSYDFPKSIVEKATLNNVKIYVSGKNLATWTDWHGWDPEHASSGRSSSYGPLIKSWVFGIQVSL